MLPVNYHRFAQGLVCQVDNRFLHAVCKIKLEK